MPLNAFVRQEFGEAQAKKLVNIRRGGDNNSKGAGFEIFYAAAKVCEIAANHPESLDDFLLSSQELAFVDDLCLRQVSAGSKVNYQAKNSSGQAAVWDTEMENRFRMQIQIDSGYHGTLINQQVLLVSCQDMAAANDAKIPKELKENCSSEFFPYDAGSTRLLYASAELRDNLKAICNADDLSTLDVAFRCVVSAWVCEDEARSVGDILGMAKADSKPNVFRDSIRECPSIPDWLHRLCLAFPDLKARVEFGGFKVSCNGLDISLGLSPDEPSPRVLEGLDDMGSVFTFLMSHTQKEL